MSIRATNKPTCNFHGTHGGNVHAYQARKFAELDGRRVSNAPAEEFFACERHIPDPEDPKFVLCTCRLCLERNQTTGGN